MAEHSIHAQVRPEVPRSLRRALRNIKVEVRSIDAVRPYPNNANKHSKKQIGKLTDSLIEFGWTFPILIDDDGVIIAGHGRWEAAKRLGFEKVPVICLSDLSDAQVKAYRLTDNRLAQDAAWDNELVAMELQVLDGLDFDLEATGFEMGEIDFFIDGLNDAAGDDVPEEIPQIEADQRAVTQTGDVWLLGKHRIVCGDSTVLSVYQTLMAGAVARMVFTDPPYNVPVDGHVSGNGAVKHREFAMASGEMTEEAFRTFLHKWLTRIVACSLDGALLYVCIDWRHHHSVINVADALGLEHKNTCVWVKNNGGMGSLYRSRHELVVVLKTGKARHINNVELGKHGRNRTNVWEYAGANTFRDGRMEDLAMHPTVKPTDMVADAIMDTSKRGDIVLDPFCGSGTTIIAAERAGRHAYAIEIDPLYCDTAIRRWQAETGQDAVLEASGESAGKTFNQIQRHRQATSDKKETNDV